MQCNAMWSKHTAFSSAQFSSVWSSSVRSRRRSILHLEETLGVDHGTTRLHPFQKPNNILRKYHFISPPLPTTRQVNPRGHAAGSCIEAKANPQLSWSEPGSKKITPPKNNPPPTLSEAQVTNDLDSSGSENFITSDDDIASIHTNSESSNQETSINDTDSSNSIQNSDVTKSEPKPSNHMLNKTQAITNKEMSDNNSIHSSAPQSPKNKPKIPPIILKGSAWRKVAGKLMTLIPDDSIDAKAFGPDSIKLQCFDTNQFRIVQNFLTTKNTEYHTFSLPDERTLKIVIKGLLREITDTEVSEELTNLGYTVTNVRQFGKQDQKLPIHMVVLKNTPENKGIFNLRSLFYMSIKIERYKSNTPAQCYNCQQFGHSSLHCGASPRCVKCAGNHKAKDCTKSPEEKPKCTNCEGGHTENYKNCPAIAQETEKRRPLKPKTQEPSSQSTKIQTNQFNSATPTLIQPKISYAERTKSKEKTTVKSTSEQLQNLISNISLDNIGLKTIFFTIVAILPLLLNLLNHL